MDWKVIIPMALLFVAFLLSPLLFPDSPGISEKIMYAWFASMGLGMGPTAVRIALGKNNDWK